MKENLCKKSGYEIYQRNDVREAILLHKFSLIKDQISLKFFYGILPQFRF